MSKFTKTSIAKLLHAGEARIHWDDDLAGFGLRIYASGVAAYVVDFRLRGSRAKRRIVLGKADELTPQMARERCLEIKAAARNGVDLDKDLRAGVIRREDEARRRAAAMTVGQAVGAYFASFETTPSKRGGRRPASSTVRQEGVWLRRIIAMHGEKAVHGLTTEDAQAVLDATPQSSARNVFGAIGRFTAWARRKALIDASPLERIDPPVRPASRNRTPSPLEVGAILKAADDLVAGGRWKKTQRDAIWLAALTAQRRGEVAAMAWEDIDLEAHEWRQPGSKNKTGKPHVVPLGGRAHALLKARWEATGQPSAGLVAPGVRFGGRMDTSFGDLQNRLRTVTGIKFRLHDFRRSAVSAMAERGVDFAVADSILNHAAAQSRGGMLGVYQHAELKPAKRRAMEIWEGALFDEPSTANVIPMHRKEAG
ncbi:MAG TPA: site-specific integrase [Roseiarcus sp.]|jgi:integrase|nr:site-specific integrase [Roseiarcus sp.]